MEVYGTEEYQTLGTETILVNQFISIFGLFMGFVYNKINIDISPDL